MPNLNNQPLRGLLLSAAVAAGAWLQAGPALAQADSTLTVAGGCFWCVEADFERVTGVTEAVSGYTGGSVENPTYREVTRGGTGHYEAVEIMYDSDVVDRRRLLNLFFRSIDPTDAGGQFCDRGESYRTAVFVASEEERQMAEAAKAAAEAELGQEIVTPILDLAEFYEAEDYHQDYYKGEQIVLTRGGPKSQASAYKFYREGCRRDERIRELWGDDAPFLP
ncbi:methionine-S-sulfoxide reductase [Oceanicola granulosus HTCC2516]|uniref:Peptide methionine sulfoxide reductase MsrA n=1 Tax=Oceanicola granulosus (strain ATCC BAA-861 / DSM 15982 / KCTC 12143 / HTCC2516) TaxID=314256 RepID=Q2CJS9_OCEGH|nr:peptide-methionine (S)-S-oxide reductase MsrA [Oceanicola granulosus]EAR53060.1 methionine-S-sulfoxide reductase [Oceanicola granulosus HTCC2516]